MTFQPHWRGVITEQDEPGLVMTTFEPQLTEMKMDK